MDYYPDSDSVLLLRREQLERQRLRQWLLRLLLIEQNVPNKYPWAPTGAQGYFCGFHRNTIA